MELRVKRWLFLSLCFFLFGSLPSALVIFNLQKSPDNTFPILELAAKNRATLLDVRLQHCTEEAEHTARDLATLLAQLPSNSWGKAAESTLILYLQHKLSQSHEISEYNLLNSEGQILVSTTANTSTISRQGLPEVEPTAQQTTISILQDIQQKPQFVFITPIQVKNHLNKFLITRLSREAGLNECCAPEKSIDINFITANGVAFCTSSIRPIIARLGSEIGSGHLWADQLPVAFASLQNVHGAIVAMGQKKTNSEQIQWKKLVTGMILLFFLSGVIAWLLNR